MDYTVTFSGSKRGGYKVGVRGVSCSSEAERTARREHPEHDDKPVHDICRSSSSSDIPAGAGSIDVRRKALAE